MFLSVSINKVSLQRISLYMVVSKFFSLKNIQGVLINSKMYNHQTKA